MRVRMILMLFLLTGSLAWTQGPSVPASPEQEVRKAEQEWLEAENHGDRIALERLIADDFVGMTFSGAIVGKQDILSVPDQPRK